MDKDKALKLILEWSNYEAHVLPKELHKAVEEALAHPPLPVQPEQEHINYSEWNYNPITGEKIWAQPPLPVQPEQVSLTDDRWKQAAQYWFGQYRQLITGETNSANKVLDEWSNKVLDEWFNNNFPPLPVQPEQEPTCPKCKNNRQVWTNQITSLKTCHRVGCTWEQPAQERQPLTDEQANKLLWIGAVPTTNGAIYREPLSYRKELMAHRLQGLRLGEAAHNIGARP